MEFQRGVGRLGHGPRATLSMGTPTRCSGTSSVGTIPSKVTEQFGISTPVQLTKCLTLSFLFFFLLSTIIFDEH